MKEKFIFSKSIGQLEARSCNETLSSTDEHKTIEIVRWNDDSMSCYTVAYFKVGVESADLNFVDGRPFDEKINREDFWKLAKCSYEILKSLT